MGLLQTLIGQARRPEGFVGKLMIRIMNKAHSAMTAWGLAKIAVKEDAPVLDIGCGGGQTLHTLAKHTSRCTLYGIDYSRQAVETSLLKNREAVAAGRMRIDQGDVSALPFADHYFGTITAVQTHYFWPDLENNVREVHRVLRPGGTFIIISEIYKINYHMKKYTNNEEMEQLFREAGFQAVELHETRQWRCYVGYK